MHNFSRATGYAIARLIHEMDDHEVEDDDLPVELVEEISAFAEKWKPKWKFSYTIGLILGAKLTLDGFHVVDIIGEVR